MARPSDREFQLKRKVKELEEQNGRLEVENAKLRKQIEKSEPLKENKKKPAKSISKPCPDCGAEVKCTELPHAIMELCSASCGYRKVRNK